MARRLEDMLGRRPSVRLQDPHAPRQRLTRQRIGQRAPNDWTRAPRSDGLTLTLGYGRRYVDGRLTRQMDDLRQREQRWFTPGVRGIGLASFLSDLGHEVPTALLPRFITWAGPPPHSA